MVQALQELEFQVDHCPEIFAAVEKLTSHAFQIIVVDWDEGLEASFLLKTARDLKSNSNAFEIAIASQGESANAARQAGADLTISKPMQAQSAKYAMLTCDSFLSQMKLWLPEMLAAKTEAPVQPAVEPARSEIKNSRQALLALNVPVPRQENIPRKPEPRPSAPAPAPMSSALAPYLKKRTTKAISPKKGTWLLSAALCASALSVSYVFSQPLHAEAAVSSVTQICERAIEKTRVWLKPSDHEEPERIEVAQTTDPKSPRSRSSKIQVIPVQEYTEPSPTSRPDPSQEPGLAPAETQPQQIAAITPARVIPESLKSPVQMGAVRTAAKIAPSLLQSLEPVALPEELSQQLLMQKVLPSYPERAQRAGLQGPVVLQAWIGRDGRIEDLKLVRGSFLLGQAAYEAVRQWRYKPYMRNGQALEAQTVVTIDFKLP